jgi:hypothetical protein
MILWSKVKRNVTFQKEGSSIDRFYREGLLRDAKAADSRTSKHIKAFCRDRLSKGGSERMALELALLGMVGLQDPKSKPQAAI